MNIHDRAYKLSRSSGVTLTEAYRVLSRRGRLRRAPRKPEPAKTYWWTDK